MVILDWDFVIEKIQEDKCVLVLGPEVFIDEKGHTYQERLIKHLEPSKNPNIYRHYELDGFFLFDNPFKRTLVCHQVKKFYQGVNPNSLIKKISEIPFHVFLTVTPDKLLQGAFDQNGFAFQYGYYKKNKDPQNISRPTKAMPLIYNVFGCIDNEESMILSYNDLYDYFKSIFTYKSMPALLKHQLKEVRNIIFLGVPFDKWYMQLLLRELNIHKQEFAFTRFAANQSITNELQTFCFEQFNINFVPNHISDFIDVLHGKIQNLGLTRSVGKDSLTELDKIKQIVAKGNIEQAIDLIIDYTIGTELHDHAIQLLGKYRKFQMRVMKGILFEDQQQVQEARVMNETLELINAAAKL